MTRTLRMMLVAGALTALAGCGVQPSGIIRGASPPSGAVAPAVASTLYLVSNGRIEPVSRSTGPMPRADALALLAQEPTEEERARGLTSEVPPAAVPFSVTTEISGRTVVTTSVSPDELSTLAVDQIACTAAAGGRQVLIFGGGGDRGPVVCPLRG